MEPTKAAQVWARLVRGGTLQDLGLSTVGGRIDLRGLNVPEPSVVRQFVTAGAELSELGGLTVIRGGRWQDIDFTKANLNDLRFFDSQIENCVFERARCKDWRLWGSSVVGTTFRAADLRESALGGVEMGKRNSYRGVDFTKADLRGTAHFSADMIDCVFSDTKLANVDFAGTVFVDCRFEGDLSDVLFYARAFRGEAYPRNEMRGVDLRRARLHFVGFRGLDMNTVLWPEGDEHILLDDYPAALDRLITVLKARQDAPSRGLAGLLADARKWVGPNQQKGLISKADLREAGGEAMVNDFLNLCGNRGSS
jgi:uncharacterized protein YjbI with pentapeptide repeats